MSTNLYKSIRNFNSKLSAEYAEIFSKLSSEQKPDALFIGCSDSRIMPSLFSSSDPGELFMVRNVGNLVPLSDLQGVAIGDESEAAAIEYALEHLNIDDIVVCGHSECGAMNALLKGRHHLHAPNLLRWLRHADRAFEFMGQIKTHEKISEVNLLSQANVLLQIENIKTYPIVKELLSQKKLVIHAWWIDIKTSQVYSFDSLTQSFKLIQ